MTTIGRHLAARTARRLRYQVIENNWINIIKNGGKDMLLIHNIKNKIWDRLYKFIHKEDGMGVVEIILITIVLISLVIIFKSQISSLVSTILGKMSSQANTV